MNGNIQVCNNSYGDRVTGGLFFGSPPSSRQWIPPPLLDRYTYIGCISWSNPPIIDVTLTATSSFAMGTPWTTFLLIIVPLATYLWSTGWTSVTKRRKSDVMFMKHSKKENSILGNGWCRHWKKCKAVLYVTATTFQNWSTRICRILPHILLAWT